MVKCVFESIRVMQLMLMEKKCFGKYHIDLLCETLLAICIMNLFFINDFCSIFTMNYSRLHVYSNAD
jgi:hypothetical protein